MVELAGDMFMNVGKYVDDNNAVSVDILREMTEGDSWTSA